MEEKRKKKIQIASIVFLCIIAFTIRLFPIQIAHWWDETVYLQHAEILFSGRENYDEFAFRPPLLPILIAAGYGIVHQEVMANIIAALLAVGAVIGIFLIGKEWYGLKTGWVAAIMMAFLPLIVKHAHYIMTDVPALSLITFAIYFLIKAHKKDSKKYYGVSGFFFALAILMKFTSLIFLAVLPCYMWVHKLKIKKMISVAIGLGIGLAPYLVWAQVTQGYFLQPFLRAQMQVSDKNEGILFYFVNMPELFLLIGGVGILGWIWMMLQNKEKEKNAKKMDAVFLMMAGIFLIYLSLSAHKEVRYMIPIALPGVMLASRGIVHLTERKRGKIKYGVVFIMVFIAGYSFAASVAPLTNPIINTEKTEEMEVADYINAQYEKDTVLYVSYNYPVFAYYTGMKTIRLLEENMKENQERGIFILYEKIDASKKEWLKENRQLKEVKQFNEITIYSDT